ncbi:MAG: hypothetical protein KatS3mg039_1267 [Candidatus Kapaibacterium sp.]|nr:MAG: hypothetical protein KatS3mg039_1267 [Candidatus Kapabacteria bacterium]
MKRVFKWIGIAIAVALGGVVVFVIGMMLWVNSRLDRTYHIEPRAVAVLTDSASVAEGKRLFSIYCSECHGDNAAGTAFFHNPSLGSVNAPNLTRGRGGVATLYHNTSDWVRAIRHGITPEGKPTFIMPSKDFHYLSDADVGHLVAFLRTAPAADGVGRKRELTTLAKVLVGMGAFGDIISAEVIPHDSVPPTRPRGVTAAYGNYLITTFGCRGCHGERLAGGKHPDPEGPPGPNLTPGGNLGSWDEDVFITNIRGRRSRWMPFVQLGRMSDDELRAIWSYLHGLPALPTATQ